MNPLLIILAITLFVMVVILAVRLHDVAEAHRETQHLYDSRVALTTRQAGILEQQSSVITEQADHIREQKAAIDTLMKPPLEPGRLARNTFNGTWGIISRVEGDTVSMDTVTTPPDGHGPQQHLAVQVKREYVDVLR